MMKTLFAAATVLAMAAPALACPDWQASPTFG